MPKADVAFDKQFNGYDRDQVDEYIKNLTTAYQTAYDEYQTVCAKYNELLESFQEMEARERARPDADVISKTLVTTEMFAQKILADAKAEAERIRLESQIEAEAAKTAARKLTDDAAVTAAAAKQLAQKMIAEAQDEAVRIEVRAKGSVDLANDEIAQLINKMHGLMAPTTDTRTASEKDLDALIKIRSMGA
jgi:DivIVA domain-containing protein